MRIVALLLLLTGLPCAAGGDDFRNSARAILAKHGVASDVDSLLKALQGDSRPIVRLTAADLLAYLKERKAVPVMRAAALTEPDEMVRAHVGQDLVDLQGEGAHQLVSSLLAASKELDNRVYLAGGLAQLGDFSGYPDVVSGLASENNATYFLAVFALGTFLEKCRNCDLVPSPVDASRTIVNSPTSSPWRREQAVMALAHRRDDPEVLAILKRVAETDQDQSVRKAAKLCLDTAGLVGQ